MNRVARLNKCSAFLKGKIGFPDHQYLVFTEFIKTLYVRRELKILTNQDQFNIKIVKAIYFSRN